MNPEKPEKLEVKRRADGTFQKGSTGNRNGRPPGQTLKEYWKMKFKLMTDEEKEAFSEKVGLETIWRMAEGNPHSTSDETHVVEVVTPIYGGLSIQGHDGK